MAEKFFVSSQSIGQRNWSTIGRDRSGKSASPRPRSAVRKRRGRLSNGMTHASFEEPKSQFQGWGYFPKSISPPGRWQPGFGAQVSGPWHPEETSMGWLPGSSEGVGDLRFRFSNGSPNGIFSHPWPGFCSRTPFNCREVPQRGGLT